MIFVHHTCLICHISEITVIISLAQQRIGKSLRCQQLIHILSVKITSISSDYGIYQRHHKRNRRLCFRKQKLKLLLSHQWARCFYDYNPFCVFCDSMQSYLYRLRARIASCDIFTNDHDIFFIHQLT